MEPCESQCDAKKWMIASEQKMWLWKGRSGSNSKESNANLGKAHSAILFTNPVFLNLSRSLWLPKLAIMLNSRSRHLESDQKVFAPNTYILLTGSKNQFEITNPNFHQFSSPILQHFFYCIFRQKQSNWSKDQENSGFAVSELVVGSDVQDKNIYFKTFSLQ